MRSPAARLTILQLMAMVVLIAIGMFFSRFFFDPEFGYATIRSPRFSEIGFSTLHVGMAREEVEAIMGPPLRKVPWSGYTYPVAGGDENWWYTMPRGDGSYWRRWVIFRKGKVVAIIKEWYID